MNRQLGDIFKDMVDVYEESKLATPPETTDDHSTDDLEKRMSEMIDNKLAEVAKNNQGKEINNENEKPTHKETERANPETHTETETETK